MLGAILGDIIGSPYEQKENNIRTTDFPLFSDQSTFTDDTVMTAAVAQGLMDSYQREDDVVSNTLTMQLRAFGRSYPARGYGELFQAWIIADGAPAYQSFGNGSAMRVSAAGWLYPTLEETLHAAKLTAEVTHNHPEGIRGAQTIAAAIFLARAGCEKQDIRNYLMRKFGYDLTKSVREYRAAHIYSTTCQDTVPEALAAFFEGNGFVDVVRRAVSMGGDSDTIAAMAGSVAEAYFGIPENLEREAYRRLDRNLGDVVRRFHAFYFQNDCRPKDSWQAEVFYNPELKGLKKLETAIDEFYERSGNGALQPDLVFEEFIKLMDSNTEVLVTVRKPSQNLEREKRSGGVEIECISDNQGHIMMPLFTDPSQLGKQSDYVLTIGVSDLINTLRGSSQIYGLIINPYGSNFVITKETAEYLVMKQEALEDQREREAVRSAARKEAGQAGPKKVPKTLNVGKSIDPDTTREEVPADFVPDGEEPKWEEPTENKQV